MAIATAAMAEDPPLLSQVGTIPLPGVEGRIDHMALDDAGQRLFVVALGNNTVEVIDLRAGRRVRSLGGFKEPQGVGFVTSPPRLFVANGGDGSCAVLEGDSLRLVRTVHFSEDADNIRVDPAARRVYVGFGNGTVGTLDAATGETLGRVELPGHPEAFEVAKGASRAYVNVPEAGEVSVVDLARERVVDHWKLGDSHSNFPMAFDPAGERLFIGCRRPAEVLVLDAATGKRLARIPVDGDVDDLSYDAPARRLIASCGEGFIDVVAVPASGVPHVIGRIPTAAGARTSLFDAAHGSLFLAVPHRDRKAAEVRIFRMARE